MGRDATKGVQARQNRSRTANNDDDPQCPHAQGTIRQRNFPARTPLAIALPMTGTRARVGPIFLLVRYTSIFRWSRSRRKLRVGCAAGIPVGARVSPYPVVCWGNTEFRGAGRRWNPLRHSHTTMHRP